MTAGERGLFWKKHIRSTCASRVRAPSNHFNTRHVKRIDCLNSCPRDILLKLADRHKGRIGLSGALPKPHVVPWFSRWTAPSHLAGLVLGADRQRVQHNKTIVEPDTILVTQWTVLASLQLSCDMADKIQAKDKQRSVSAHSMFACAQSQDLGFRCTSSEGVIGHGKYSLFTSKHRVPTPVCLLGFACQLGLGNRRHDELSHASASYSDSYRHQCKSNR